MKNWAFYQSIHGRGLTVQKLADAIHSGRTHVTQVLNNQPGRGGHTRKKLIPLLNFDEIKALDWCEEAFYVEQSPKKKGQS